MAVQRGEFQGVFSDFVKYSAVIFKHTYTSNKTVNVNLWLIVKRNGPRTSLVEIFE